MKNQHTINQGLLFPMQFLLLGYAFIIIGLAIIIEIAWLGPIIILFGLLIVTAQSGFDFKDTQYRIFYRLLFIKFGKWLSHNGIEKVYINGVKTSQKFYGRANLGSTIQGYLYKAYLKFKDGKKVLLVEHKSKTKVLHELEVLNQFLNTEIKDNT